MPEWCFRSCDLDLMSGLSTIQEETLIGGDMKKSSFSVVLLVFGLLCLSPKGRPEKEDQWISDSTKVSKGSVVFLDCSLLIF